MSGLQRWQRLSAYGITRRQDQVLLVRLGPNPYGDEGLWMLPGGGVEHGEHPAETVIREFREETGYDVEVGRLLDIGSERRVLSERFDFHGVFVLFEVTVTGGKVRDEADGPMRTPTWVALSDVDNWPHLPPVGDVLRRLAAPCPPGDRPVGGAGPDRAASPGTPLTFT